MRCNARGKGEAVLLIHGMPTNGRLWDGVIRDLCRYFRCFVIDLPGLGGTPFLPYTSSYLTQVADQVEQVRIRNHVQRWHIVGHDGGCAVAVQYAYLFPKRVNCMSLLSPAILPELKPFFLLELLRRRIIGELTAPIVHTLFWQIAMRRAISDVRFASQRASFHQTFSGPSGPWKLMQLVRWGRPEMVFQDVPTMLQTLDCPTLVIHGSRDILPESFAERTAELITNSQLLEMDSGHFIPIERALEVSQNLMAYFKSHGSATATISGPSYGMRPRSRTTSVGLLQSPALN